MPLAPIPIRAALAAVWILALAPAVRARPADIAAAVAAPDRPAKDRALDEGRKPVDVLSFERLETGDNVLDYDAGGGYYSEILSRAVGPKGHVTAFLFPYSAREDEATWKDRTARLPNVTTLVAPPDAAPLAANTYDFVLIHLVYHDLYWSSDKYHFPRVEPRAILRQLYASVRRGGTVAVIDHVGRAGNTREIVDKTHRIDPLTIKTDFQTAGFRLQAESRVLRNPADDPDVLVFDPKVRGHTDRVVYRFVKPY